MPAFILNTALPRVVDRDLMENREKPLRYFLLSLAEFEIAEGLTFFSICFNGVFYVD